MQIIHSGWSYVSCSQFFKVPDRFFSHNHKPFHRAVFQRFWFLVFLAFVAEQLWRRFQPAEQVGEILGTDATIGRGHDVKGTINSRNVTGD